MKLYIIYDSKSESYNNPFVQQARGQAIRTFSDLGKSNDTDIGKYPSDFTLFEIGDYDPHIGIIDLYSAKINLGLASELISE